MHILHFSTGINRPTGLYVSGSVPFSKEMPPNAAWIESTGKGTGEKVLESAFHGESVSGQLKAPCEQTKKGARGS